MRTLLVLPVLLAIAAPAPAAPQQATAQLGQIVRFGGLAVRPIKVLEDSRCPRMVTCVWRGRLRVSIQVGQRRVALDDGVPVKVRGGELTLVDAIPVSARGEQVAPGAYRFRLRYDR